MKEGDICRTVENHPINVIVQIKIVSGAVVRAEVLETNVRGYTVGETYTFLTDIFILNTPEIPELESGLITALDTLQKKLI